MVWTRSDRISAGSLAIASLALLYGPVKDYQTAASVPSGQIVIGKCLAPEREGSSAMDSTRESVPDQSPDAEPDQAGPLPPPTPNVPAPTGTLDTTCRVQYDETLVPDPPASDYDDVVFDKVQINGSSDNVPADRDLWIVLRPEDDGQYYPVARARRLGDGAWSLGDSSLDLVQIPKSGITYDIFLYMADSQPSRQLATWDEREDRKPREQYEGMPSLPPNLVLLGSESIERPI